MGLGVDGDNAGGRAISLFGDFGLGDDSWLSSTAAYTRNQGIFGFDAVYLDAAIDHNFDPIGVRLGVAYWGDSELFDSLDFRGSAYFRNDRFSFSADYERRNFDFTFHSLLTDIERTTSFYADGYGITSWLETSKNTSLYIGGMDYQYSVDIRLQENIDALRFLSLSRLSLINSLVDRRFSGGLSVRIGSRNLDFNISRWRTELDEGRVTSYGVSFTTPLDDFSDLELRVAYDDSENFGNIYVFSVFFYTFGS